MTGRLRKRNGYYLLVLNLPKDEQAGKYRTKTITTGLKVTGNQRKAEKLLKQAILDYEQQEQENETAQQNMAMSVLIKEWLRVKKTEVRPNSYEAYRQTAESQILPFFNDLRVSVQDLQPKHIQEYYTSRIEKGLKPDTLDKHRTIIRGSLDYAVNTLMIIKGNPANRAKLPKKEDRIPKFYNSEQLKALFKATENEPLGIAVRISGTFGLCRSETLGLRWSAVNFDEKTIFVQHTVVRVGSDVTYTDTVKKKARFRKLPLTDDMCGYLKKLQAHQKQMKKTCGRDYNDNDYICKWDNGKPLDPDYVTKRFGQFLKSNGFPHIRFHDLRHSSASLLINMQFTLKEVQEWLGHASIKSTEIYSHLLFESKIEMAKKVNDALSDGNSVQT